MLKKKLYFSDNNFFLTIKRRVQSTTNTITINPQQVKK